MFRKYSRLWHANVIVKLIFKFAMLFIWSIKYFEFPDNWNFFQIVISVAISDLIILCKHF